MVGLFESYEAVRKLHAASWLNLTGVLVSIGGLEGDDLLLQTMRQRVSEVGVAIGAEAERLGLTLTAVTLRKMAALSDNSTATVGDLRRLAQELDGRLRDEMDAGEYLALSRVEAELFGSTDPFGGNVIASFPSAQFDIEEAAKCLALERGTAAVFHLMRVVEVGLRLFGLSLNDPSLDPARNPNWERILSRCRAELAKPLKERSPEWQADEQFYSTAAERLMAVRDASRNPTVHPGASYDPSRAADVWSSVGAFMRQLAEKLHE
jgi:hypothetical protein